MSNAPKLSYPIGGKNVQGGFPTAVLNTLQFNAVTNVWDFVAGGAASLGDLEFLRDKELSGDILKASATGTTIGVLTSIIPAAGKTFFYLGYQVNPESGTQQGSIHRVRNNAVIRCGTTMKNGGGAANSQTNSDNGDGMKIDVLVGDGVLVYDIHVFRIDTGSAIRGFLHGWIQDT